MDNKQTHAQNTGTHRYYRPISITTNYSVTVQGLSPWTKSLCYWGRMGLVVERYFNQLISPYKKGVNGTQVLLLETDRQGKILYARLLDRSSSGKPFSSVSVP